jgi:hypothetical protein
MQEFEEASSDLQTTELAFELQSQFNLQIQSTKSIIAHKLAFMRELEHEVLTCDHEHVMILSITRGNKRMTFVS